MDNAKSTKPRQRKPSKGTKPLRPLGEVMAAITASVPPEAWEGFPKDASRRIEDYMEPEWVDGEPVFPDE